MDQSGIRHQPTKVDRSSRRCSLADTLVVSAAVLLACFVSSSVDSAADEVVAAKSSSAGVIADESFDYPAGTLRDGDRGSGWQRDWIVSRAAVPNITSGLSTTASPTSARRALEIRGTGARNNPLRRPLRRPLVQGEVFVRFDLRYVGELNEPPSIDPEFFVLWLDRLDGGDRATHAANVPNIGLHVADRGPEQGRNVFMIRIGPANVAWTNVEVQADRTYRVVARLSKSKAGDRADYDRLEMWIDPIAGESTAADASVSVTQGISEVQWVGFSTGLKTESTDRIQVGNLLLADSWEAVLNDSAASVARANPRGHNGVVWDRPVDFRRDVYPLLESQCFDCHAGERPDSGYRLDVYRELLGYSSGESLAEPGRSRHSRLIEAVAAKSEQDRMPPEGMEPLSDQQIAMLIAWIDQGMTWDSELLPPPPRRESDHWAFQAIVRPEVPVVAAQSTTSDANWIRTPVDAFIQRAHVAVGLRPARQATKQTLVRRLYLDVIGLPPTVDQVEQFLQNGSETAYEDLVERLLQSPHYGERWARYWLDLSRWAESQGYQHDIVRPYAWRYRDYVIDSFNADKPYDQFLKEQLAGDELQPYSDESLIATGFLAAARISGNQEDESIQRNDVMIDIVNATGSAILGLTLECAQCHNHKFDPISQRDYYRLQAFFVKGQLGNLSLRDPDVENPTNLADWIPKPAFDFYAREVKTLVKQKLYKRNDQPRTWGYLSADTGDPGITRYPVVNRRPIKWQPESLRRAEARMLIRGDSGMPGPVVKSGWPEVLGTTPESLGPRPRSALADWMTDANNPLVSRVWVNRLWQYHFGRGIVATSSDFGVEGAKPTHPELLDWLASELIDSGWSSKAIHRQILLSSTYRQERLHSESNAAIDIDNRLLWQWPRRRLDAEAIRDSVLVASGELDRSVGGISVPPDREEQRPRRTIYLFQQRSDMPSVMAMFDAPEGIVSCSRRAVSTVALQPLFLLNSEFMAKRAAVIASAVSESAGDSHQQIELAFLRTLSRRPDADELAFARRFVNSEPGHDSLTQLCHALLNLNEFVYIP